MCYLLIMEKSLLTKSMPSKVYFCIFLYRNGLTAYKISKFVYGNPNVRRHTLTILAKLEKEGLIIITEEGKKRAPVKIIKPNIVKLIEEIDRVYELKLTEEEKKALIDYVSKADPFTFIFPFVEEEQVSLFLKGLTSFLDWFLSYHKLILITIESIFDHSLDTAVYEAVNKNLPEIKRVFELLGIRQWGEIITLMFSLPFSLLKKVRDAKLSLIYENNISLFSGLVFAIKMLSPKLKIEIKKE